MLAPPLARVFLLAEAQRIALGELRRLGEIAHQRVVRGRGEQRARHQRRIGQLLEEPLPRLQRLVDAARARERRGGAEERLVEEQPLGMRAGELQERLGLRGVGPGRVGDRVGALLLDAFQPRRHPGFAEIFLR